MIRLLGYNIVTGGSMRTKRSGIYRITCKANGDRYIGSSKNVNTRKADHWSNLRSGIHHNRHMQGVWNKYGRDTFIFDVIEDVAESSLIEREQWWLDAEKPELNKALRAESGFLGQKHTAESKMVMAEKQKARMKSKKRRDYLSRLASSQKRNVGYRHKDSTKAKLREATVKQFSTGASRESHSRLMKKVMKSPEIRQKISLAKTGLKQSQETVKKRAVGMKKAWDTYTPEQRAKRIKKTGAAIVKAKAKKYDGFVSPTGKVYKDVYNLAEFCRKHGLLNSKMGDVSRGKRRQHKGWRRI